MVISGLLLFFAVVLVFELLAILMLYSNVGSYSQYWKERASEAGEFVYVAYGDSVAQGLGARPALKGYVGIIADRVKQKTGKSVRVINLSKSGAKIKDVVDNQIPHANKLKPDLITIEIGANDIASFDSVRFKKEFTQLTKQLPKGTYVSNMPYFGSRPKRRAAAFEATSIIEQTLEGQKHLKLVNLQTITQDRDSWRNYAADYFHPNNRAYQNWADAFWQQIERDL